MNLLPWSYTKLTAFERCPRYGRARYILKTLPYVETEALKEGNRVHKVMEDLIEEGVQPSDKDAWLAEFIPDVKDNEVVHAEQWFNLNEDGSTSCKRSWFTAKIDLYHIEDDDICWVIDWKTGKPWEDPDQLNIESAFLNATYPHVRHWRGMYVWLKERRVGEVHSLSPAKTLVKMRERVKAVDTSDTPKKNPLCPWCTLSTCKYYTGGEGK